MLSEEKCLEYWGTLNKTALNLGVTINIGCYLSPMVNKRETWILSSLSLSLGLSYAAVVYKACYNLRNIADHGPIQKDVFLCLLWLCFEIKWELIIQCLVTIRSLVAESMHADTFDCEFKWNSSFHETNY